MQKVFSVLLLLLLVGCSPKSEEKKDLKTEELVGEDRQVAVAYADSVVENLLGGFNEGVYSKYSRDFDEQMKNALSEEIFSQTRQLLQSKIGSYRTKEVSTVPKYGPYITVIYKAEFDDEKEVQVKVVFQKYDDENLVSGLWFDSPKLRE